MNRFPEISDAQDFKRWRFAPDLWSPVVREIARVADIDVASLTPFETGTNLVVDLDGSVVLKLFPPIYTAQFASERAALRLLDGRLSFPTPSIFAEGQEGGWSWLIITKLSGTVGSEIWPSLSESERTRIVGQVGRAIAEVQAISPEDLVAIEPTWPNFIASQAERCVERHRRQQLPEQLLKDLAALVNDVPYVLPSDVRPVILTGEWIPENLLLSQTPDGWQLGAVIDFGDVMTGWGEYDLLGPSTFMCAGVPGRLRSLLQGYGVTANTYDAKMRRRLMTLMVLHRASDLRKIDIAGWASAINRLHDVEDLIWPKIF